MDSLIEFIIDVIYEITGRRERDKMPDGLEYKESFTVKPYPKNVILYMLGVAVILTVGLIAYFEGETVFGYVFIASAVLLFLICLFLELDRYEIDSARIVRHRLLSVREIPWSEVREVKLLEKSYDSSVTIALYSEDRLLVDFISPKKNFWQILKTAEHLGFDIVKEKDASISKIISHK